MTKTDRNRQAVSGRRITKADPERLGRLSMSGLTVEEALRGAMQVRVPPPAPRKRKARRKAKKKR